MARDENSGGGKAIWLLAAGAIVGLGAALWYGSRRRADLAGSPGGELGGLEDGVIEALRRDRLLKSRAIDVAAIAPGIIELTGSVDSDEEAHHAVDVVQSVTGVKTVLNRLDLAEFQQRTRKGRGRPKSEVAGDGARWYGNGVGMGRRRQSYATDPAQRDDHGALLEEALLPDPEDVVAELNEERVERSQAMGTRGANELS